MQCFHSSQERASESRLAVLLLACVIGAQLDVSEEELQARVKALAAAEAAQAAATAATDASAARAANGASNGSNKKAAAAAAAARPSAVGTVSAERAGSAVPLAAAAVAPSSPFVAAHNNLKDWGRRMEAYRQVVQEDAADLASKVRGVCVCGYVCDSIECHVESCSCARNLDRATTKQLGYARSVAW